MVKKIILLLLVTSTIYANFKTDCVLCHRAKHISLRKVFMNALLVYGGEKNFKIGLFYYCKNPNILSSVMNEEFLKRYMPLNGLKISDKKLQKLIDIYWQKYKIIGNLK